MTECVELLPGYNSAAAGPRVWTVKRFAIVSMTGRRLHIIQATTENISARRLRRIVTVCLLSALEK